MLDDDSNTLQVLDIPELSSVNGPPAEFIPEPGYIVPWKDGPRRSCELSILATWRPLVRRADKLVTIIHWDSDSLGMTLLDFNDPDDLRIVKEWHNDHNNSNNTSHGVFSGALHTVHVRGMAIPAGRRFVVRLEKGDGSHEFRVLGYSLTSEVPSSFSVPVEFPNEEWDQAEAYDSCTVFGRIVIRQYDGSSDSEHSDSQSYPSLVLVDFV